MVISLEIRADSEKGKLSKSLDSVCVIAEDNPLPFERINLLPIYDILGDTF